jgi:RNA polymerase sigma-70 factor, ECF subfamily
MHQQNTEPIADDHSLFPSLTDEQLAVRAQEGSSACFGALVDRFESRLLTFLTKRLGNTHTAQDIAQDTFVKAWEKRDRYNTRWRYSTWLYTIASRRASNHLRQQASRNTLSHNIDPVARDTPHVSSALATHEAHTLVWQLAAKHLSSNQHTILWLRYGEDLSCKDIARVLSTTSVAVRAALHRARKTLREHLLKAQASHEHARKPATAHAQTPQLVQHRTLHLESVK